MIGQRDRSGDFERHLAEPAVSPDDYYQAKVLELGRSLGRRSPIYLDTRFWIHVRDVRAGVETDAARARFAELVTLAVQEGLAFFPISETIFLEVMRQSDPLTRAATARLMDELSLGVCLQSFDVRVLTEISHFICSGLRPDEVRPIEHLIWTKSAYVFGVMHPVGTGLGSTAERVIQKCMIDEMWSASLDELVTAMGEGEQPPSPWQDLARDTNVGNIAHAASMRSYQQVYRDELAGAVGLFGEVAGEAAYHAVGIADGPWVGLSSHEREHHVRRWAGLLHAAGQQEHGQRALRTLHIEASLHAIARWNRTRKLKANDFPDMHHAAAAVGYCKALFTERSLAATLKAKPLSLDQFFGCFVTSAVGDANSYLESLMKSITGSDDPGHAPS